MNPQIFSSTLLTRLRIPSPTASVALKMQEGASKANRERQTTMATTNGIQFRARGPAWFNLLPLAGFIGGVLTFYGWPAWAGTGVAVFVLATGLVIKSLTFLSIDEDVVRYGLCGRKTAGVSDIAYFSQQTSWVGGRPRTIYIGWRDGNTSLLWFLTFRRTYTGNLTNTDNYSRSNRRFIDAFESSMARLGIATFLTPG